MDTTQFMPVPLYHGTSLYFLPGILEHGLGATDIHTQLRSREFYKDAWEARLRIAGADEREKLLRNYGHRSDCIINNQVTAGGFDYRYGSVYCTGEERKAVT